MMKKILCVVGCVVLSFSLILGTVQQGAAKDPVVLKVYDFGDANDKQIRDAAIERFNKSYPDVKVELNFSPISNWSDFVNKLMIQIAGGRAPDLIHLAIEGTRLTVDKNLLMPLDEYIGPDGKDKDILEDFDDAILQGFIVDGKIYQMPAAWNNMLIYYNTKMFADKGIERPAEDWTWDDFLEIAQKFTSEADQTWGFGIPYFNFGLTPFWYSNDTSQLKNDLTESNLDDPKMIEAVTFVRDLVYKYKVSPSIASTDPNAVYNLFVTGKIALCGGGHWPMQFFMANNFSDYDVLPWPQKRTTTTVYGVDGWGIFSKTKHKDVAWELIKEFTSKETLQATTEIGVAIPARRSLASSESFLKYPPHANLFYESLQWAKPVAAPKNFNEYEQIFMRHLDRIMADEVSPEEGLREAHEELSEAME